MKNYQRINNLSGWSIFSIAAFVYVKTLQPTGSFWDCGEFIASAFKLQVGHQPGAPLFLMIGRVFSLIAKTPSQIAFWVNLSSALSSAATILFLFWTITALALKLANKQNTELSRIQILTIMSAGAVGALAYTFSDSFWFSAVEAEVYALSSLCTAVLFWAILKWDASADDPASNRWLVFIAYIVGLSIGIHLLNLLAIPAVVVVWYFRKASKVTLKNTVLAIVAGCFILGFVQYGIIQYLILFASKFDLVFVNSFHFGFGSGALVFVLLLISAITWGILYSIKKHKFYLNLGLVCLSFILLGYSSYALIVIRANAKTDINLSNPDTAVSLLGYLGRDQYGDRPLLYGKYYDANATSLNEDGVLYRKGKDEYEVAGTKYSRNYDRNTILPRIYDEDKSHPAFYKSWLNIQEGEIPGFAENLGFLTTYQIGYMYLRYFMWNFVGRQDDVQGNGFNDHGNWLTGIKKIDSFRFGNQDQLPISITQNEGFNRFYGLPFILGIIGLVYHFRKNKKDAGVIGLLFFFTGIAIVLYLNQTPMQPRERDYAFVGSFYAFAIWIGLGVLAIKDLLSRIAPAKAATFSSVALCMLAVPYLMASQGWDDHDRSDKLTAKETAINYLESCAPNAILFTNADNDTYPLWYVQQVEGIRKDVRIVNLQLLYSDAYVNQLKKQMLNSAPLPITMPGEKYVKGVRDYLPFVDYGFKDSVELSEVLEVMLSDNDADKVEMQDGSKENFLPTKRLKLSVNADQVIKTGTLRPEYRNKIADKIEWTYNKEYVSRAELAFFDILAHNNWKRPIYIASSLSADSYFGLDKYLYSEGLTYRLLPIKREIVDTREKEELTNSKEMYSHLMNNFKLDSFKNAKYLDELSRTYLSSTWQSFNILSANLIAEGNIPQAKNVMQKALKSFPLRNYTSQDTVNKYFAAINMYKLNKPEQGNLLITAAKDFLGSELKYYAGLSDERQRQSSGEIDRAVSILVACRNLAQDNKQYAVVKSIESLYSDLDGKLIFSFKG